MKNTKRIDAANMPPKYPFLTTIVFFLVMHEFVWPISTANVWGWVVMGIITFMIWVSWIYDMANRKQVDLFITLDILKSKVDILWADVTPEKRNLMKGMLEELLKSEGLVNIEKKSFVDRVNEAIAQKKS